MWTSRRPAVGSSNWLDLDVSYTLGWNHKTYDEEYGARKKQNERGVPEPDDVWRGEPQPSCDHAAPLAREPAGDQIQQHRHREALGDRNEFYFYFITFDNPRSLDPSTRQDVVVLLDGSVVEPVRRKT